MRLAFAAALSLVLPSLALAGGPADGHRVQLRSPRAVPSDVVERARLSWAADALPEPIAPAQPTTLDRLLADADRQARQRVGAPQGSDHDLAQGPAPASQPGPAGTAASATAPVAPSR